MDGVKPHPMTTCLRDAADLLREFAETEAAKGRHQRLSRALLFLESVLALINHARAEEREACAVLAESTVEKFKRMEFRWGDGPNIAGAIRTRATGEPDAK